MAKANVDVAEIFAMMSTKNEQIATLKEKQKALEKEIDLMEKQLIASIPANGVKAGVQHVVTTRTSVSYAQALAAVVAKLVPKTKAAEVAVIEAEFTKVSEQHKFKAV